MNGVKPTTFYSMARADSPALKAATIMRRRMFDFFMATFKPTTGDSVLDVGATADDSYEGSNFFEQWYPAKPSVTAFGIDDAAFLTKKYPGLCFVRGDGRALPFRDNAFAYVHSHAVVEHVGSRQHQRQFVEELTRVPQKAVFLTTPNRWFPVETHTLLPLAHWLPAPLFRAILRKWGWSS